jgi:6-phosphofructokinase
MAQTIGILTSGGDTPGLNAAIRGVGKACLSRYGMHIVGIRDGFRGFMENRTMALEGDALSGILTLGGTILGTSRDKPHKMPVNGKIQDMTGAIVANYHALGLDGLVCLGGGGTQKNALRLKQAGLNVVTLPKTIDNDVALTDTTFGFDTALGIATDAIDRLHSTAHSHHRIIVVEIMGHRAGWLALGAGIAGGADVILIPEIPYDVKAVADAIKTRKRKGKPFSIVAVAEGAIPGRNSRRSRPAPAGKRTRSPRKSSRSRNWSTPSAPCAWPTNWKNSPAWKPGSPSWATCNAAAPPPPPTACSPPAWAPPPPT